jgi:general secretion pathway protein G
MKTKKRHITLLEIMIVIFLISLIGGVIGYNMKGSLEKGKAFKTQQAMNQLDDIFQLEAAKGDRSNREIVLNARSVLEMSGLVKNPDELLKDGWNNKFVIKANKDGFEITSKKLQEYNQKHAVDNTEQKAKEDNYEEQE